MEHTHKFWPVFVIFRSYILKEIYNFGPAISVYWSYTLKGIHKVGPVLAIYLVTTWSTFMRFAHVCNILELYHEGNL